MMRPGRRLSADSVTGLVLVAAVLMGAVGPTSLVHEVPTWMLVACLVGQALLYLAQVEMLRERVRTLVWSVWLDPLAWALALGAVLAASFGLDYAVVAGISAAQSALTFVLVAAALASAIFAVSMVIALGVRNDRRLVAMTVGALSNVATQALLVARAGGVLAVPDAVLQVGMLGITAGYVLMLVASPRVPSGGRQLSWKREVVSSVGTVLTALAVLSLAGTRTMPGVAVVLALLAVATVGVKGVSMLREIVALQGSHQDAMTDELTGLPNRRALLRALEQATARQADVALLMLDLDRFKQVNDGLGHHVGDELLCQVAHRLTSVVPSGALLARLGGDEFAVLLPSGYGAVELADRLVASLAGAFVLGGATVHVGSSAGIATVPERVGGAGPFDATDLLRRADTAMYASKARGTGPVRHDDTLDDRARTRLVEMEELREALATKQIGLFYQPQVDIATGTVSGVEALVRWHHPVHGTIAPFRFLTLAEETGLLPAITRTVLEQAVAQAAAWHREGLGVPVSVNLAADDISPVLVEKIEDLLRRNELPSKLLTLEITETSVLRDQDAAARILREIADLGVGVSLDDYGTGHSSLLLLLRLPVDEVKIDRSFVASLLDDARHLAVIRSTIDLAHHLGMSVVAEGVETAAMLEALRSLDCDVSQGYLHSPPAPAGQIRALLKHRNRTPRQGGARTVAVHRA